jgi:undecaprenyl-diphosphatase
LDLNWRILDWINDLAGNSSLLDHTMEAVAQYAVYAIVAIAVASWFVRSRDDEHRLAVYAGGIAAVISLAIALLIQHFYVHQRPFVLQTNPLVLNNDVTVLVHHAADASFPSEHATGAFAIAAGVGTYRHRLGLLLLVLAALVAFSRVYVGIHYPADVAGGAAIGVLVAIALWFARPALAWLDRTVVTRIVPAPLR